MKMDINEEVQTAFSDSKAVVALESTIITHGLPYPDNLQTAQAIEAEVRACGAVPATIAIIDGRVKIGLTAGELEMLASPDSQAEKASRRDLPYLFASAGTGSTTVAATMILAERAGICVFATGGIGGVHKGAETSFDISADLPELAQTKLCVVCAGPKAILDIPLTMEYLETHGVPVIGYQTDEVPAFWSRGGTGVNVPLRLDSANDIAQLIFHKWQAELVGGVLVANPVPAEDEIAAREIQNAIAEAVGQAEQQGITGKAVTPFMLDYIRQLTKGRSLKANKALIVNNARLAAQIAIAYSRLS